VAAQSKAKVCGQSFPGMTGSNPAGGKDVFYCSCYVLSRSLRRTDPGSRRGLPSMYVSMC
jgi:hypothetical protein